MAYAVLYCSNKIVGGLIISQRFYVGNAKRFQADII